MVYFSCTWFLQLIPKIDHLADVVLHVSGALRYHFKAVLGIGAGS